MRNRRFRRRLLAIFILVSLLASANSIAIGRGLTGVTAQAKMVVNSVDNDPENKL